MSGLSKSTTFYNYFPTPAYLTLSTAGISITDDSIHLMELHHGLFGNGLKLSFYEQIALPEGIVESGFINNVEKLTAILSDISRRYGIRFARATLPEERAYLFNASIDQVPLEGMRDAVAFIIEENVPVTLANSVFDFDVLGITEEGKIRIVVSVISRKVVDFYLQVFEAAGITPVSFDIESQAIARAAVPKGDKSAQMIINLGEKKTGFYVLENEVVQFTTTLPYGATADGTRLGDLQAEIRKIFAYWSAHNKVGTEESKIEKVLVCGVASLDNSFVTELMSDCPVPYDWVSPWLNVSSSSGKLPSELIKDAFSYVPAIGLAIPHPHRTYV